MAEQQNNNLNLAIIFAATVVSGSLVFLGTQFSDASKVTTADLLAALQANVGAPTAPADARPVAPAAERPTTVEGDFTDDDPFLGDDDAPVVIVEFSDYECPFCASFYRDTLPQIKEKYIDTGKVKLVYRDFPLSFHPDAYPAALFAECARDQGGDDVYFEIHDELFATISAGGFDFDDMSAFAADLGVDEDELKECYDNEDFKDEIYADQADGQRAGINGTPGFIVNGTIVSGAQPFANFEAIIEAALEDE